MKKFLSVLLSICLIFGIYSPVHAASGPASSFEQGPVSDTGAWSYIKIYTPDGSRSRTHYIFRQSPESSQPV